MALPRAFTPPSLWAPGMYFTDGHRLIYVLEVDHSGAIGEDARSGLLVEISLARMRSWRRVLPRRADGDG